MEDEATSKLKLPDLQLILRIPRKYTKAGFFRCIKFVYQLVFLTISWKSNFKQSFQAACDEIDMMFNKETFCPWNFLNYVKFVGATTLQLQ